MNRILSIFVSTFLLITPAITPVAAQTTTKAVAPVTQVIVGFKVAPALDRNNAPAESVVPNSTFVRMLGAKYAVYKLNTPIAPEHFIGFSRDIEQKANVKSVEADAQVVSQSVYPDSFMPTDPLYNSQWYLQPSGSFAGGANFTQAWKLTRGTSSVPIGVLDTGTVSHADLSGKVITGYDFLTDLVEAGDGDARDADPAEVMQATCTLGGTPKNRHGLHMTALVSAVANNSIGISGAAPDSQVLGVRATSACGGSLTDALAAMRWSAGLTESGVPSNPNPVKVVSASFSAVTECVGYIQDTIDELTAAGVIVVAAAGNQGNPTVNSPANCEGVIAVGGATSNGDLATFSNRSTLLDVLAPGGGDPESLPTDFTYRGGLVTLSSTEQGEDTTVSTAGTSPATALVSSAVSLALAVNPGLSPAELISLLKTTSRAVPVGSYCQINPSACGAVGLLDAGAMVSAAGYILSPVVEDEQNQLSNGVELVLNIVNKGAGTTIDWSGVGAVAQNAMQSNGETLEVTFPSNYLGALQYQVTVTNPNATPFVDSYVVRTPVPSMEVRSFTGSNTKEYFLEKAQYPSIVDVVLKTATNAYQIAEDDTGYYLETVTQPQSVSPSAIGVSAIDTILEYAVVGSDSAEESNTGEISVVQAQTTPPPSSTGGSTGASSGGGGGGGAMNLWGLLALAFFLKRFKR